MKQLAFKLQIFEGPLDLLLHLIHKNKVSIYDIPIAEITEQYMDYLEEMDHFDIELSSEFLVLAANLLYIKSRMILPKPKEEAGEDDPRLELVQRLTEYRRIQMSAQTLSQREFAGGRRFYKTREYIEPLLIDESLKLVKPGHLQTAMEAIYQKLQDRKPPSEKNFTGIVGREPIPVFSKIKQFLGKLKLLRKIKFLELFRGMKSRDEAVASFLAVLELAKMNRIQISEDKEGILLTYRKGGKKEEQLGETEN
jgi:segregation and condensation protein A